MRAQIEKQNHLGKFVWDYTGVVVSRDKSSIVIEARMNRDIETSYVTFRKGDRMVETFYADRWYNIMQIHDVDDDRLKGWYCNITRAPSITDNSDQTVLIAYQDLALDAYISPVGDLLVLDEDELAALQLPAYDLARAWYALGLLRGQLEHRLQPFNIIQG